jgi:hypothetical protein
LAVLMIWESWDWKDALRRDLAAVKRREKKARSAGVP